MRRAALIVLVSLCASAPCRAFLGVGDITFDPAVHAELITMYQQALRLYRNTIREIVRLDAIRTALQSAQANVHRVLDAPLAQYAAGGLALPPAFASLTRVSSDGHPGGVVGYYRHQLRRLRGLSRGAHAGAATAAGDLGVRTSNDITAQSTATLAVLATQRARAHTRHALRRAEARRNDQRIASETAAVYAALGGA